MALLSTTHITQHHMPPSSTNQHCLHHSHRCLADERRGWLGDAALGVKAIAYNYDANTFYDHVANLMADDQAKAIDGDDEGALPNWVRTQHFW